MFRAEGEDCSGGEGGLAIPGVCWLASMLKVSLPQARKVEAENGGEEPLTSAETGLPFGTCGRSGMALVCLCLRVMPRSHSLC